MIFQYFSSHIKLSRTFEESPLNSSTFHVLAHPVCLTDNLKLAYNAPGVGLRAIGGGEGPKGKISLNFNYKVNSKDFQTKLCVSSHK